MHDGALGFLVLVARLNISSFCKVRFLVNRLQAPDKGILRTDLETASIDRRNIFQQ